MPKHYRRRRKPSEANATTLSERSAGRRTNGRTSKRTHGAGQKPAKRGRGAKSRDASLVTDVEPTADEMEIEQARIDEDYADAKSKDRRGPPPGRDLLASYMDHLSHIPLFNPKEENENARNLEALELATWTLILEHPRGVQTLCSEAGELDEAVREIILKLDQNYRRALTRTKGRKVAPSKSRQKLIDELGRAMRFADYDKEILEGVMKRLQRDVTCRRVHTEPALRVTKAQLEAIEKARIKATTVRNDFVRANLRLVVSVARNFHHYRIPFIDLIQEGNVGLMKAVHRFDHRRGFRFSTYAHWWIRQSIERAIINKGSQVRLPVHVIDSRRQIGRAQARLTQRLARTPTIGEIAKTTKMNDGKVEQILGGVQQDPVSLDETVSNDDPRKFVDLVRDETKSDLDDALIQENTFDRIRELLQLLNPMERDIIRRRFGLADDNDQTLDEIGKLYNLSRERVRQIQAQGLMKMRRMCERREIDPNS